jgi:hypothetical protein
MKLVAAALLGLTVVSLGCTRDLELPGTSAFAVTASPATVAPRQTSTITISGGAGSFASYAVDFDAGGKLSGDDASVVNNGDGTATYRAGRNGSTQDTVVVRDTSGAERRVIITVGARLAVTPQVATAAPGGSITFAASGGKSPYVFEVVLPDGSFVRSVPADPLDGTKGIYTAGIAGDTEEIVRVSDATGDVAASTTARVLVGTRLQLYRTTTGPVAPNEEVTVVAIGGRPSYTYGPPWDPVTGGFKDTTKGVFMVGTQWSIGQLATATVTDQNGQTAYLAMDVGPPLAATLASPLVRPGVGNRIEVSGGKAPYAFRFADRGNHSHGSVDQFSGVYVSGSSPGALDRLEVEDATGTVAAVADVVPVGPIEIVTGSDVERCVGADYDGDGLEDLAFLYRGMSLLEVTRAFSADAFYRSYYVADGFRFPAVYARDHAGDGRAELMFVGARSDGPDFGGTPLGLWGLLPDMTGLFANPNNLMVTWMYGGQAAVWRDAADTVTRYVGSSPGNGSGSCTTDTLEMAVWSDGASGPSVSTNCTPTIASRSLLESPIAFLFADFTGDGLGDILWLAASTSTTYVNTWNTPGPIHVRVRSGAGFVVGTDLGLPSGTTYIGEGNGEQGRFLRVPARPPLVKDGLLVRLRDNTTGRGVVAFAAQGAGGNLEWKYQKFDPFQGKASGTGTASLALVSSYSGGPPLVAALSGTDGTVAVFDPWMASPAAATVADVTFPASYGCQVDADADGFPDLAVGGERANLARLLWGSGNGRFGSRARLAGPTILGGSGDVDGDGLQDLVVADETALYAMFGDAGQLGWDATPITSLQLASVAVGRFTDYGGLLPAGTDSIIFQTIDGDYYTVRRDLDGTFLPPSPVSGSGGSRVPHGWLQPAELGGYPSSGIPGDACELPGSCNAPGPDLIAPENDNYGNSWIHVITRKLESSFEEHMSKPVGQVDFSTINKTHACAFVPVHVGTNYAVASLCSYELPAGQPAAAWAVKGWPIAWATPLWYDAFWKQAGALQAGSAGTETGVAPIGMFEDGAGNGRAYFVVGTSKLQVVEVNPNGNALDPAAWTFTTKDVASTRRLFPFHGRTADLDGDGKLDAVVGGMGLTTVLRNTSAGTLPSFDRLESESTSPGTSYEVPAAGIPLLAGPLGFTTGTTPEKGSVVLFPLTVGGLQIVRPDGTGRLQ